MRKLATIYPDGDVSFHDCNHSFEDSDIFIFKTIKKLLFEKKTVNEINQTLRELYPEDNIQFRKNGA